jgi:hypothetical protein
MKTVLLLLLAFPTWVVAQNVVDSLPRNTSLSVEMPSDTGVAKADTLADNQYYSKEKTFPTKIDSLPEIKIKKNIPLLILALYTGYYIFGANANEYHVGDKTYFGVRRLAPYILKTNDDVAIDLYGKHRQTRPVYIGLMVGGYTMTIVGLIYSIGNSFGRRQAYSGEEYIYAGLGMMAGSIAVRISSFRNLRKSVTRYNDLRKISYNLQPSSSSLGLSFSVGF